MTIAIVLLVAFWLPTALLTVSYVFVCDRIVRHVSKREGCPERDQHRQAWTHATEALMVAAERGGSINSATDAVDAALFLQDKLELPDVERVSIITKVGITLQSRVGRGAPNGS